MVIFAKPEIGLSASTLASGNPNAGAQGGLACAICRGHVNAEKRGNRSKLPEVAAAVRLADSCQVGIRLAVAKSCAGSERAMVFVSGLEFKGFRNNRSIARRDRLVRALLKPY